MIVSFFLGFAVPPCGAPVLAVLYCCKERDTQKRISLFDFQEWEWTQDACNFSSIPSS